MRYILCMCVLCGGGCCDQARRPRWEVVLAVQVESKVDATTKATGGLVLKRPIPGLPPVGAGNGDTNKKGDK